MKLTSLFNSMLKTYLSWYQKHMRFNTQPCSSRPQHNGGEWSCVCVLHSKMTFQNFPITRDNPQTWLWTVFTGTTSYWRNRPLKSVLTVRSVSGTENTLRWRCSKANQWMRRSDEEEETWRENWPYLRICTLEATCRLFLHTCDPSLRWRHAATHATHTVTQHIHAAAHFIYTHVHTLYLFDLWPGVYRLRDRISWW